MSSQLVQAFFETTSEPAGSRSAHVRTSKSVMSVVMSLPARLLFPVYHGDHVAMMRSASDAMEAAVAPERKGFALKAAEARRVQAVRRSPNVGPAPAPSRAASAPLIAAGFATTTVPAGAAAIVFGEKDAVSGTRGRGCAGRSCVRENALRVNELRARTHL
jgi:hypothetical protein